MTIKRLYKLELGHTLNILNKPFIYVGYANVQLESGHVVRWLFDDEGRILSVSPQDEELILLREIEDDLEPEDETITWNDKEYRFESEDVGTVRESEGESPTEEDERFLFSDYQAVGSEIIRLLENETTGESTVYAGMFVSDDDLSEM